MANVENNVAVKNGNKILTMESLNPNIRVMEYAVRGPIVTRAVEIGKELKQVIIMLRCHAVGHFYE